MKNWRQLINDTTISAAIFTLSLSSLIAPAEAGWDPIKNTPLDPGTWSGARDSVVDSVENAANGNKFRLYVQNKCHKPVKVTLEYKPLHGGDSWFTNHYDFSPGEKAYLVDTQNKYVYLAAQENYTSNGYEWNRKEVNMGSTYNTYTYSFTCSG